MRSFVLQSVDATHPLQDERGKFRIVGLSVAPNPFDPPAEVNSLNALVEVDSVKGLNGNSPNHLFFAMTKRVILDPLTLEPVRTVYGVTELDREADKPLTVSVVDAWDGTDETGALVERYRGYPMDIEIMVARTYVGNGSGARCSVDEERLSDDMMQAAFAELLTGAQWQAMLLRGCMVAKSELLFAPWVGTYAVVSFKHNITVCAESCLDAWFSCTNTTLADFGNKTRCGVCLERCNQVQGAKDDGSLPWSEWPELSSTHQDCDYWHYPTRKDNEVYLPAACFPTPFQPNVHRAKDCAQALRTCMMTENNDKYPESGAFDFHCDHCESECLQDCRDNDSATKCQWPTGTTGRGPCNYWVYDKLLVPNSNGSEDPPCPDLPEQTGISACP